MQPVSAWLSHLDTAQKMKFSIRISSANVTKSPENSELTELLFSLEI